jgi:hypothetical protein
MSGGIAELFLSCRDKEQIYLLKRKGFVRHPPAACVCACMCACVWGDAAWRGVRPPPCSHCMRVCRVRVAL